LDSKLAGNGPYGKSECGATDTKAGRGLMQSQRNGLIATHRMKYQQDSDAMFFAVRALADASIALHDKVVVNECTEIVEAMQVGQHLTMQSSRQ